MGQVEVMPAVSALSPELVTARVPLTTAASSTRHSCVLTSIFASSCGFVWYLLGTLPDSSLPAPNSTSSRHGVEANPASMPLFYAFHLLQESVSCYEGLNPDLCYFFSAPFLVRCRPSSLWVSPLVSIPTAPPWARPPASLTGLTTTIHTGGAGVGRRPGFNSVLPLMS